MIEKTLDVTELPVAETVKDGDQLLLVRPNGDGTKTAMRIDGAVLKQTKVKKVQEQYVIGRAVKPRACEQGHMVNWYVFGTVLEPALSVAYIPLLGEILKDGSLKTPENVYIKYELDNDNTYREVDVFNLHQNKQFGICSVYIDNELFHEDHLVIGIRVDKYVKDVDGYISAVWLSWREVSRNIRAASTHHWFEGSYRQYRPIDGDRRFIAKRIDPDGEIFLSFFEDLRYEAIICKKMNKYNNHGENTREEQNLPDIRKLVFKRLSFPKKTYFVEQQTSHAKRVGGLYRAIPIYSICKTKGRPVYFYIRQMVRQISVGNYKTIRLIEWK